MDSGCPSHTDLRPGAHRGSSVQSGFRSRGPRPDGAVAVGGFRLSGFAAEAECEDVTTTCATGIVLIG